jgi:hypothetical protein
MHRSRRIIFLSQVVFNGFKLLDNMRAGGEIVIYQGPKGKAGFRNTLVVARSGQVQVPFPHSLRDIRDPDVGRVVGMWPSGYSYNLTYENIAFVNFDGNDTFTWSNCAHCNFPNTKNNEGKTNYMKAIT